MTARLQHREETEAAARHPSPRPWPQAHLIIQVQVVELAVGAEVLRAPVQREVDAPALALDDHRVPVVVVQQAACRHRRVAVDGTQLVASCVGRVGKRQGSGTRAPSSSCPCVDNTTTGALSAEVAMGKPACHSP